MSKPVALQLYTVREAMKQDFFGTLKKVAQIGYKGVEWAGLFGRTPQEARSIIDDLGLKSVGTHAGLDALSNPQKVIDEAGILGHDLVGVPYWPEPKRNAQGYAELAAGLNASGAKLNAAGMSVFYHNHDFEFQPLPGGDRGFDILLRQTDPKLVNFEVDMGWVWVGTRGQDPAEAIEPFADRVVLLHIKDFQAPPESKKMAEVGTGKIDYRPTVEAAGRWPVRWFIIEQDRDWIDGDSIKSVAMSFEGFGKML